MINSDSTIETPQATESTVLIPHLETSAVRYKLFLTNLVNLTGSTINAAGAFGIWDQYARALRHCKPNEFQCSEAITVETSYITLAAATVNVIFHIIAKKIEQNKPIPARLLMRIWNTLVNVLDMHYFYLGLALFLHSLAIHGTRSNKVKLTTLHAIFWTAEVIPSSLLAISSDKLIRSKLRNLMTSDGPRGISAKLFDTFFGLLRGFATVRGIIFEIELLINKFYPKYHILTSLTGMLIRYVSSGAYGIYEAYRGWMLPTQVNTQQSISEFSWPHTTQNCLNTLFFLIFTGITIAEAPAIHRSILLISFSALFLSIIGYTHFNRDTNIPLNINSATEEYATRDRNSIQILTSANSNYRTAPFLSPQITRRPIDTPEALILFKNRKSLSF